ncbi:hypothetical protein K469DRAFT_703741 [Zopfia rhizophila CBS 207.26]|uniref:DUF3533 domain-containing protein n=1 Tax=Zopfia rhizophila CBS 207.26 TaxID=1314779 RepID=A0A6A6EEE2_9PEZI|nr:hypothetical protein K469DRAFT_703741 [Zopfia rhizophila CBS 207.26]
MVNIGIKSLRHLRQKPTLTNNNRVSFSNDQWKGIRTKFTVQTTAGGTAFMLWFLACCSYLYGTLFESRNRYHNMHVLAVDYDDGVIGKSMSSAYQQLEAPGFITLKFHSREEFPTEQDVYDSVYKGKYWGAIIATERASERLSTAIQGGQAAASYNTTNALHYIWNQQYYTTFASSVVLSGLQQMVTATRVAYTKINGTQAYPFVARNDSAAVQAFLNPVSAKVTNTKVAAHGSVILFNTVSMAMPVLQQFFFILVLNGASRQHQLYTKMTVRSSLLVRRAAGLLFTLGAALCQTGYFWAFREGWSESAGQFMLTWMTFWLLMHIHYLVLDSISSVAPLPVMPFVVLLWVFLNIASTLSPLELQPGFYRWGIALPSHNAYSVLVTIWTGGASNRLYRALPILFAWWILANLTTITTHVRACHLAYKLDQEQQTSQSLDIEDKDEEAAISSPSEETSDPISRHTTARNALERRRTVDQAALEQREIYGPSIPPFSR